MPTGGRDHGAVEEKKAPSVICGVLRRMGRIGHNVR
jgi:hypothetical protein